MYFNWIEYYIMWYNFKLVVNKRINILKVYVL